MSMSYIENLLQKIDTVIQNDSSLLTKVQLELGKIARHVYADAISQNSGYCMTFKIFESQVLDLPTKFGISSDEVKTAFVNDWGVAHIDAYMVKNVYYHVLLLLFTLGLRKHNEQLQKDALMLILVKLWNGRRIKFIRYCNQDVMRYVVAHLNGKYLARKYDSPINMIIEHFIPTLINKYGSKINSDPKATKTLFDTSWVRFTQIFVSKKVPDLKTGVKYGKSGLAPLYYDANEHNLKIAKSGSNIDSVNTDNEVKHSDLYSINDNDEIVNGLVNYIVMNFNAINTYDPKFFDFLNEVSMVNHRAIKLLISGIHNIEYSDYIREIIELMFKQLQGQNSRMEICSPAFLQEVIKKKFISSKHSIIITQLKDIVDSLLEKIFEKKVPNYKYSDYSPPRKGHLRKIIFYTMAYNIQKFICSMS